MEPMNTPLEIASSRSGSKKVIINGVIKSATTARIDNITAHLWVLGDGVSGPLENKKGGFIYGKCLFGLSDI